MIRQHGNNRPPVCCAKGIKSILISGLINDLARRNIARKFVKRVGRDP